MTEKVMSSVGKRKTSIARVYMKPGTGVITVNNRAFDEYFIRPIAKMLAQETLKLIEQDQKWDVMVNVCGGGLMGQAGAIRHAISKAFAEMDRAKYRGVLKKGGFLTRDSRIKERKKYGQKAARAKFQFSKR